MREQNALPTQAYLPIHLTAKDAIDNGGAGRAAKGESPVRVTSKKDKRNACLFCCVLPSGEPIGSREQALLERELRILKESSIYKILGLDVTFFEYTS